MLENECGNGPTELNGEMAECGEYLNAVQLKTVQLYNCTNVQLYNCITVHCTTEHCTIVQHVWFG